MGIAGPRQLTPGSGKQSISTKTIESAEQSRSACDGSARSAAQSRPEIAKPNPFNNLTFLQNVFKKSAKSAGQSELTSVFATVSPFRGTSERGRNVPERTSSARRRSAGFSRQSDAIESFRYLPLGPLGVGDKGRVFAAPASGAGCAFVDAYGGEHAFEREVSEAVGTYELADRIDIGSSGGKENHSISRSGCYPSFVRKRATRPVATAPSSDRRGA